MMASATTFWILVLLGTLNILGVWLRDEVFDRYFPRKDWEIGALSRLENGLLVIASRTYRHSLAFFAITSAMVFLLVFALSCLWQFIAG